MELITTVLLVAICVVIEGFFSGTEIALISISRHKLAHLIEQGDKAAQILEEMFKSPATLYGTTSIGTNLFVVMGVAVMTAYFSELFPESADFWTVVVMAPLTLLFGEIFPKAFFQRWADKVAYIAVYPLKASQKLFTPILWVTTGIARLALRSLGAAEGHDVKAITYEEIRKVLDMGEQKLDLHPDEEKMINRIFTFKNITVEQCMVPLVNLAAVEINEPINSVKARLYETRYSRMPVYKKRIYNITGIINAFDLLRYGAGAKKASDLAKPVFYVYKAKKADDLLTEMQDAGVQAAIVVNEYLAAIGMVTREDLVEEIFGEIEDEYDKDKDVPRVRKLGSDRWEVDGDVEVDILNDQYGWNLPNLPEGDYETIAGYILTLKEAIPLKGDKAEIGDFVFTVSDATEMGIRQLKVRRKKKEKPN